MATKTDDKDDNKDKMTGAEHLRKAQEYVKNPQDMASFTKDREKREKEAKEKAKEDRAEKAKADKEKADAAK